MVLIVCGVVPRAASLNPASHLIGICVAMSLFEQVLAFGLESSSDFTILFMEISDVGAFAKWSSVDSSEGTFTGVKSSCFISSWFIDSVATASLVSTLSRLARLLPLSGSCHSRSTNEYCRRSSHSRLPFEYTGSSGFLSIHWRLTTAP